MRAEIETLSTKDLIAAGKLAIGDGYRAKNVELSTTGIPFARAGNIDNGFQFEGADKFPEEDLMKVGEKISRPGDVVFTSKGTVGRFAFVHDETPRFVFSPQLCYWRSLDADVIDPLYLYYWMNGKEFWDQAAAVKGDTDMADYVSLTEQRRMKLTLPPIEIQREIRKILGALDDKIELNRQMNHTLEAMAQAVFKSWFVDFEPVTAKAEGRKPHCINANIAVLFPSHFIESELGPIPEGWVTKPLDEIADFLNGLALQKYPPEGEQYLPVIKIAELKNGITKKSDRASVNLPKDYIINDGDIIFSWSGSLENIIWCGGEGALNQHLFKVTSQNYTKWFYYFWIHYHLPDFREIASGKATTMGHIRRHDLTDAKVVCPKRELLQVADQIVGPIFERLVNNKLENRVLIETRDTLLPKLLSGEVCFKDAEKQAEAVA